MGNSILKGRILMDAENLISLSCINEPTKTSILHFLKSITMLQMYL